MNKNYLETVKRFSSLKDYFDGEYFYLKKSIERLIDNCIKDEAAEPRIGDLFAVRISLRKALHIAGRNKDFDRIEFMNGLILNLEEDLKRGSPGDFETLKMTDKKWDHGTINIQTFINHPFFNKVSRNQHVVKSVNIIELLLEDKHAALFYKTNISKAEDSLGQENGIKEFDSIIEVSEPLAYLGFEIYKSLFEAGEKWKEKYIDTIKRHKNIDKVISKFNAILNLFRASPSLVSHHKF